LSSVGDVKKEIVMKKQALLITLASALAVGATTTAFAQEAPQNGYGYYQNGYGNGSQYAPNYGNTGAGQGEGNGEQ
jgi:hypothetical protein